jgi:hypothetical protein
MNPQLLPAQLREDAPGRSRMSRDGGHDPARTSRQVDGLQDDLDGDRRAVRRLVVHQDRRDIAFTGDERSDEAGQARHFGRLFGAWRRCGR